MDCLAENATFRPESERLAFDVTALLDGSLDDLTATLGLVRRNMPIPAAPTVLSYERVTALRLPARERQALLESALSEERLRQLATILRRERMLRYRAGTGGAVHHVGRADFSTN